MFELRTNPVLCQNINNTHLQVIYYGRGLVDSNWRGEVLNPVYSRLYYIVSGEGSKMIQDSNEVVLEPGNWYLFPAGCSFSYSCKDSLDHIYFHLKLCDVEGIDLLHACKNPIQIHTSWTDDVEYFTKGLDCQSVLDSLKIRHRIFEVLLSLLNKDGVILESKKLSPCVLRAIHYIRENLSIQLSTAQIAEAAEVSESTLTKRFRRELTMSVHDYVENLVFSEAVTLLRESDLSVMSISERYGFCDQFYFSRRFKEKIGSAPRNFRKVFV